MLLSPQRYRALLHLKPQKLNPTFPLPLFFLKLKFCTTSSESESESESDSFTVSYLINKVGLSPESALKASKRLCLKTPEKPDSVFTFFKNRGFSDSNIRQIVKKEPRLLSSNLQTSILPKFELFVSKGASASDIVRMLTASPIILHRSLEDAIIPLYELLNRFLKSDANTIACLIRFWNIFSYNRTISNIKLMVDYGVSDLSMARLLLTRPSILRSANLIKSLEEVKGLGFDPSKCIFGVALVAKKGMGKRRWNEKVIAFKKWGWSDEHILEAFKRQPQCMLVFIDKINLVMSFWVNQLGWDALAIVKDPRIIGFSLERRIIPRASILQFLLKKGLLKQTASLVNPFTKPEEFFLKNFVNCFKESSDLLKLYEEKLNLASNKETPGMLFTKFVT